MGDFFSNLEDSVKLLFSSKSSKIILVAFIATIIIIPVGSIVINQRIKAQKTPDKLPYDNTVTKTATSSGKQISKSTSSPVPLDELTGEPVSPSPTPSSLTNSTASIISGPSLNFAVQLQGRPVASQSAQMFVGIASGSTAVNSPQYIVSFTVNIPSDGKFKGLSLAGLTQGQNYTAYLKGPAQIATSSAFLVTPTVTQLNGGSPLTLLSGDLNEDNVINAADYGIAQAAYGATPGSPKWNANIDLNQDNIINNFDTAYIVANFGKIGASGPWQSTPPSKTTGSPMLETESTISATPSGSYSNPPPPNPSGGYWIWVPHVLDN